MLVFLRCPRSIPRFISRGTCRSGHFARIPRWATIPGFLSQKHVTPIQEALKKADKTLPCGQATKGIDCRPCSAVSLGINRVRMMQFWRRSPYPGSFRALHSCQLLIRKTSGSVSRRPGVSKSGLLTFFAKFAVVLVEWHCQILGGPGMFHCKPQKPWQLRPVFSRPP